MARLRSRKLQFAETESSFTFIRKTIPVNYDGKRGKRMSKQRWHYFISGYCYAPESYRAYKKLSENGRNIQIPMTNDEQNTMALYCYSKGFQKAIDYVKQIERKKLRKNEKFITYGFYTIEAPKIYLYSVSIRCRSDANIQERLHCKKSFEEYLRSINGKVERCTECVLDANYQPKEIKRAYWTTDFNRPLIIYLVA